MSGEGGSATVITLGDLGRASERLVRSHEVSIYVLGAWIDVQRLLVPIHRLLPIFRLALPRRSRDLPQ